MYARAPALHHSNLAAAAARLLPQLQIAMSLDVNGLVSPCDYL